MIELKTKLRKKCKKTINLIAVGLIYLFHVLHIVRLTDDFDRSKICNRTLVFIDEGKRRKINIRNIGILGCQTRFFIICHKGKKIIFDRLPLGESYYKVSLRTVDDKFKVKKILKKNNISTPRGCVFKRLLQACVYAKKIGYPVVIKPVGGSLSVNVFIDLKNEFDLKRAISQLKISENNFLLEEFIEGKNYRAIVVDNKFIGCVMRYPAHVVGDGKKSIKKLIRDKNKHPLRGDGLRQDTTLHKIQIDNRLKKFIALQDYGLDTVLEKNKKIFLTDKINASSGVETYDVTQKVHPKTKILFERISYIFDSKLLGIDYITKNISKAHDQTVSSVIEINPVPYIDLHHYPMKGRSINVASCIWQMVINENKI